MNYRKIAIKEKPNKTKILSDSLFLDELLLKRGIKTKKDAKLFLNPARTEFISPYAFCDMQKAKNRVLEAIEKKQKILIWGDFDCDGVTSTAILYKALKHLEADVITFIPDRLLHGHGLNSKELVKFVAKERIKLVITVDCAISNNAEVNLLKGLGVDTIITDHHDTDRELPCAYAIINPKVQGALKDDLSVSCITSLSYNSGSSIAYKLAMVLLEEIDEPDFKDELLIIASCGLVADVVPLVGENRSMVSVCLELLNTKKESSQKAIYRLLSRNSGDNPITSTDIAFVLAPRINAVGRLANAKLSFEFLTCSDDSKLDMIISKLDNYNTIRQSKCSETYQEVIEYLKNHKEEINNPAVILLNPDWHIGIIGIVASKIMEEFQKPCFLMTVDENNNARCSIRSNDTINVYQVLKENESLFLGFGGHKLAGGCSFSLDTNSFEDVKESILKTIKEQKSDDRYENVIYADLELQPEDINLETVEIINKLEPFGQNNETPLFAMFDVNLEEFKLMGKEKNHLSITVSKEGEKLRCVKWGEDNFKIPLQTRVDIAFYLKTNTFNNETSAQIELVDVYSENYSTDIKKLGFKIFDHRKKTGILSQIADYLARDGLDIGVWAKSPSTKEVLSKYEKIKSNFVEENLEHSGLMFFDYPSSYEEFIEILSEIKPKKLHLMNASIDENIENYIKQLSGMIKYCSNRLDGAFDIVKMSRALCVSEAFVQLSLEIFEAIESVEVLDIDKVRYLKPFNYEEFKQNSMFELLNSEFEKNVEFKKAIMSCKVDEIEAMAGGILAS